MPCSCLLAGSTGGTAAALSLVGMGTLRQNPRAFPCQCFADIPRGCLCTARGQCGSLRLHRGDSSHLAFADFPVHPKSSLSKSEVGQDGKDNYDQADDVNDLIHGGFPLEQAINTRHNKKLTKAHWRERLHPGVWPIANSTVAWKD